MIVLSAATDNLQVVLGGAVTTNELPCVSSWRDITTTDYTPGRTVTNTNGTTDVNAAPAPAASTQRVVDFLSVYNADTATATVTIKLDANGTEYVIWKDMLSPGDAVRYIEGAGFNVFRVYQSLKSFTVHGDAGANFTMTNATQAERLAGNTSRHIFMCDLDGYTEVRLRANQQVTSASANTPLFRAKYYTTYTTTVGNFLQLGESAQVEFSLSGTGYRDTGWMSLATGARIAGCCIGFTELGGDGVADPALGATDILFR
jgi:hypothetical protein